MKIVDNKPKEVQVSSKDLLQVGDVLLGGVSGVYYLVVDYGKKMLNLDTLLTTEIKEGTFIHGTYLHTGIKSNDITITFK